MQITPFRKKAWGTPRSFHVSWPQPCGPSKIPQGAVSSLGSAEAVSLHIIEQQRRNARAGEAGDPEKTRRPVASSNTVPTYKNPGVARPGIEPSCVVSSATNGERTFRAKISVRKCLTTIARKPLPRAGNPCEDGSNKGYTSAHIKCAIATKRKALN
ncbi:hypothetical protein PR048_021423 [Dryococelus australis]|uniref:Uncharacterized protein n=1 Tax=Dryococelus australis TaxID=614101 RepID=A0ABQ9GY67_9NEOP|nr:hypothetical protein PR048_021423 [Dryococelus australis]